MKNKLRLIVLSIGLFIVGLTTANAASTITATDVPARTYVIGTHMFSMNADMTTKDIMLAAKTIEGNTLDDMNIYYKNARGAWIDALSADSVTPPTSFSIAYQDQKVSYTITFDSNGGSAVAAQYVGAGNKVTKPANPTKTGYTFSKWKLNGSEYNFSTATVSGAITLVAEWTVNQYDITYNLNSGTNNANNKDKYTYGIGLTLSDPTRTGHAFGGWFTDAEFTPTNAVTSISTTDTGVKTFYAKWTAEEYNVTYYDQGANDNTTYSGSEINSSLKKYTYGAGFTLPIVTKAGYRFDGWYTSHNGNTQATSITNTDTGVKTFYAKWTAADYTITYYDQGLADEQAFSGSTPIAANKKAYAFGSTLELPTGLTKAGYNLEGWYTAYNGGTKVTSITATDLGNKTFYAKWEAASYTITYYNGGGEDSIPYVGSTISTSDKTYTYGVGKILPEVTRDGYEFIGWTIEYDVMIMVDSITNTDTGNKVFYAQWAPIAYTIAFDKNDAIATGTTTSKPCSYGDNCALTANGYTKTGHTFAGWATSDTGEVVYENEEEVSNLTTTDEATVTLYAKWTANEYDVNYYDQGATDKISYSGNSISDSQKKYTYGVGMSIPNTIIREGYAFGGWYTTYNGSTTASNITTTDTGDKNFYAKWTANGYNVTYYDQGATDEIAYSGSTISNDDKTYTYRQGLELPVVTKTGYIFDGWYTTYNGGTQVTSIGDTSSDIGNKTFYAKWTPITYTIAFNKNAENVDGTTGDVSCTYGSNCVLTTNGYTKTGYTFAGWATSASGEKEYNNGVTVSNLTTTNGGTVTLYAKWTVNGYNVTYYDQGATNEITYSGSVISEDNKTYTYGTGLTLPIVTKIGYRFDGWYTLHNGGTQVTSILATDTGNKTLYAKWTAMDYTITYYDQGATDEIAYSGSTPIASTKTSYAYGNALELPTGLTKTGYSLEGWYTAYNGGTKVTSILATDTGNKILYAKWTPITYTIAFNGNGEDGEGTTGDVSCTYGSDCTLTTNGYTRTGYTFAGWATESTGEKAYNNGARVSNLTTTNGGTVTLYAKWTADQYDITYHLDNGENNVSNTAKYTYGIGLTLSDPTKTGYTFGGWFTDAGFTPTNEVESISTTDTGTKEFYAKWTANEYNVTYYDQGATNQIEYSGSTINSNLSKYTYGVGITLPAVTKTGYTFGGWYTTNDGSTQAESITTTDTGNKTFYAKWTPITYTIAFDGNGEDGDGTTGDVSCTYGSDCVLTTNGYTKTGHTFAGWALTSDGVVAYNDGVTVSNLTSTNGETVTLYAKWEEEIEA